MLKEQLSIFGFGFFPEQIGGLTVHNKLMIRLYFVPWCEVFDNSLYIGKIGVYF